MVESISHVKKKKNQQFYIFIDILMQNLQTSFCSFWSLRRTLTVSQESRIHNSSGKIWFMLLMSRVIILKSTKCQNAGGDLDCQIVCIPRYSNLFLLLIYSMLLEVMKSPLTAVTEATTEHLLYFTHGSVHLSQVPVRCKCKSICSYENVFHKKM